MEAAAETLGLALRLPARRPGDAGAGAGPLRAGDACAARASTPVVAAGAGPRGGALRDRLLPRRAREDLRGPEGRAVPGRAPPRSRSPRCTPTRSSRPTSCRSATRASRPASAARPAPPAATRAGSSASTSSTRSRCSASSSPGESDDEHERLLAIEERILAELEIPYRVVDIPVGDLGASAARKFDCEAWIPSQGRYRELTSCSNTTDYQARRLDCRYRPAEGASPEPVHTLNGTAVAVGRTLIALIENGQERRRNRFDASRLAGFRRSRAHSHRYELQRDSEASRPLRRPRDRPRGGQGPDGRRSSGVEIVGEAATGEEVVDVVKELEPDVCIVDVELPGQDGIEATKEILKARPETRVIIFTAHAQPDLLTLALRAGASGYVLKSAPSEDIARAIEVGRRRRHLRRHRAGPGRRRGREAARADPARARDPRAARRGPARQADRRPASASAPPPSTRTFATRSRAWRWTPAPRRSRWPCASATWAPAARSRHPVWPQP